jgi:hypothetical protein
MNKSLVPYSLTEFSGNLLEGEQIKGSLIEEFLIITSDLLFKM